MVGYREGINTSMKRKTADSVYDDSSWTSVYDVDVDVDVLNAVSTLMMMKRGCRWAQSNAVAIHDQSSEDVSVVIDAPRTIVIDDQPNANAPPVVIGEEEKVEQRFIGVHRYRRTHRWEAYIWLSDPRKQLWLGQHSCAEAGARSSDKAQLALRDPSKRKLNYPEADYRQDYIQYLRTLDLTHLSKELREQAKGNSEGCLMGLTELAANKLRAALCRASKVPPD